MSTSAQLNADPATGLRQRSCKRTACSTIKVGRTESGKPVKCCDENCLVEVARRECDTNCNDNHNDHDGKSTTDKDKAAEKARSVPCANHYEKTKEKYGTMLENLGCICKILLSLNIESCCVIPSHASSVRSGGSIRSAGSGRSGRSGILPKEEAGKEVGVKGGACGGGCCGDESVESVDTGVLGGTSEDVDDCSKEDCCSKAGQEPLPATKLTAAKVEDCSKSCCSDGSSTALTHEIPGARPVVVDVCSKESCCSGETTLPVTPSTAKAEGCSKKDCCSAGSSSTLEQAIAGPGPVEVDDCSKQSCCSGEKVKPATPLTTGKVDDCSKKSCCTDATAISTMAVPLNTAKTVCCSKEKSCCSSEIPKPTSRSSTTKAGCCSKKTQCKKEPSKLAKGNSVNRKDDCCGKDIDTESDSCCEDESNSLGNEDCSKSACCTTKAIIAPKSSMEKITVWKPTTVDKISQSPIATGIDIERGLFEVEHIVLSVHGMTCTGCEKKLYRSLDSLPTISNIKTSLVLAQAEFDLSGPTIIDGVDVIKTIEKMTGFNCTKMSQSGEELDIFVDGNVQELANRDGLPLGVTNLAVVNKNTIRVTYYPKVIGARELLSDPFFRQARLAPHAARPLIASGRAHVRTTFMITLLSAVLTIPVLVLAWAQLPPHEILYGAISLGLATIVQTVIAGPFYIGALKALVFSRMIEMDLLIVISTTTAYIYSVIAYGYLVARKPLSTGEFFETSTLLVTLIMLGRAVSAFARQRAVESISIESLQTPTALLVDPNNHHEQEIDARLLQYQDLFKVLPDTSIATDGIVLTGETEVDESMVTGEAMLVPKRPGASVIAGSINHSGTLLVRLTRLPGENTIKTIGSMVDQAKSTKPKIQELADHIAGYFVPVILGITVLVFVIWVAVRKTVRKQSTTTTCIDAMTFAISALIVSCPCAIGLAVPMVVVIAGGVAAKNGLIFKTAETIQIARNISHVIFDKTGTLTQGKLSVVAEKYPTKATKMDLGPVILGLTTNSKHPVSTAIATHLKSLQIPASTVESVVSIAGCGIEATCNGKTIQAGNPYWLGFQDLPNVREVLSLGLTVFCVSIDSELVAVYGLNDLLRLDAIEAINKLKKRSVQISLVSGDNKEAVESVARQLNIPENNIRSRCSPADKQAYVQQMLKPTKSVVLFCGDGTNDAVALAQATIGLHMNEGTDIAQSAADAILMRPSLQGILILMDLSQAFYRRVVFNFIWSFVYNVFAILLAAGAFPNARIPPQYAGLGEIVSVVPVIAVAMQLKWSRLQK